MEVFEVKKIRELSELKKKKKVQLGSGFSDFLNSSVEEKEEVAQVANSSAVANLFFLQEAEASTLQKQRSINRGSDILNKLEEFKNNLLNGEINKSKLEEIKNRLSLERAKTQDNKLEALIDEIELRAHVELAKYESDK